METVNTSPLFSYAAAAALSNGSLYRDRTRDRDELLAFMDANGDIKSVRESKRGKLKKTVEKKRDDGTIERIEIVQDNGQRLFYIFY